MKNMKMKTKMILGFMIPIALTFFNIVISNMTTKKAAAITDPHRLESYVRNASIFTVIVAEKVSPFVALWLSLSV